MWLLEITTHVVANVFMRFTERRARSRDEIPRLVPTREVGTPRSADCGKVAHQWWLPATNKAKEGGEETVTQHMATFTRNGSSTLWWSKGSLRLLHCHRRSRRSATSSKRLASFSQVQRKRRYQSLRANSTSRTIGCLIANWHKFLWPKIGRLGQKMSV